MSIVGFDLGNETSTVAIPRRKGIEVLQNEIGQRKTPTLVAFKDDHRCIGPDGVSQFSSNQKNSIWNFKRFLGMKPDCPTRAEEEWFNSYETVEKDGRVCVKVQYDGKEEILSPEQVCAAMYTKLKKVAESRSEGKVVDCVIACPPYYNEAERRAMLDAANIAGLNVLRLMNETTAIALNYGIVRPLKADETFKVAFVDIGHADTNVAVVSFTQGSLEVLSTASDRHVGGRNFDKALMVHFAADIKERYKLDVLSNRKATSKLAKECGRIKTVLSANSNCQFNVEYIMNDTDVRGSIDRKAFEAMTQDVCQRITVPCQQALERAGITKEELAYVEIVGGGSRIPCVQATLKELFGRDLSKTCDSDESVAKGCAFQVAMLSPNFRVKEFHVKDVVQYGVNLSWNPVGQQEDPENSSLVFPVGNPIPSMKLMSFKDRVDAMEIRARYADLSVLPTNTSPDIARWVVKVKDAKEGSVIKVKVRMNLHGTLELRSAQLVTEVVEMVEVQPEVAPMEDEASTEEPKGEAAKATDMNDEAAEESPKEAKPEPKLEKKVKKVKTDLQFETLMFSGMPEPVLKACFEREAAMANQDQVIAETNEIKNALESYCLTMVREVQGELSQYIEKAAADAFCNELSANEEWLWEDGFDAQRSEYKKRLDNLKKVGDPIVRRKREEESRPEYIAGLKQTITQWQQLAASTDAKYAHIEQEDRAKVVAKCAEVDAWFVGVQQQQDSQPKSQDPVFTCKGLEDKARELSNFCTPIMNKPAPKKEEPKKEEPKKEEAAEMQDEEPAAEAAAEAAAAEAADMDMD